jgi:hypothetical protein
MKRFGTCCLTVFLSTAAFLARAEEVAPLAGWWRVQGEDLFLSIENTGTFTLLIYDPQFERPEFLVPSANRGEDKGIPRRQLLERDWPLHVHSPLLNNLQSIWLQATPNSPCRGYTWKLRLSKESRALLAERKDGFFEQALNGFRIVVKEPESVLTEFEQLLHFRHFKE